MTTNSDTKYPMSVNNQQCLGPCYYRGVKIIHPLTTSEFTYVTDNVCPVAPFMKLNIVTGKKKMSFLDTCHNPTAYSTEVDIEAITNPRHVFSCSYFVRTYYKIYNIDELFSWLNHHHNDPVKTRERVFNTGMESYGKNLSFIGHHFVYFVIDLLKYYISIIYHQLKFYIYINPDSNTVNIGKYNDSVSSLPIHKQYVKSYILDKLFGENDIQSLLFKLSKNDLELLASRNASKNIIDQFIIYTINRINITVN